MRNLKLALRELARTPLFAVTAIFSLALGIDHMMTFRRTREIGIRMALGSSSFGVRWLILRETAAMICVGAVAGMALALALGRYIESFLYLMKPSVALALVLSLVSVTK